MMTPKEIARHITEVAEGKVDWTKAPCELWIEREINEYVQQQVNSVGLADFVEPIKKMKIEKIEHANFNLVEIKNGKPHCIKHGAMNKITKDGFWRCITVAGYKRIVQGNSVSEKHVENICRAGCKQL